MTERQTNEGILEAVEIHDEEAVEWAIAALSVADLERLKGSAEAWLQVLEIGGRDYEDLLSEALSRTLSGSRRWRKGVELKHHLKQTMRSIASSWRKSGDRWAASGARWVRSAELAEPGNPEPSDPIVEAAFVEAVADSDLDARRAVEAWGAHFAGDRAASEVLAGWRKDLKGPDIKERAGLSDEEFQAAVRRIRRTAQRGGPDRVD